MRPNRDAACHDVAVNGRERFRRGAWTRTGSGEAVIADLRRSPLALTGVGVRLVVLAAASGFLMGAAGNWLAGSPAWIAAIRWVVLAVAVAVAFSSLAPRFRRWSRVRGLVTNRRVRIRSENGGPGWDIPLLSIVEVRCSSGPIQRLVGVGTLTLTTNLVHEPAVLADVPRAAVVREVILALRAHEWREYQRGIAVNSHRVAQLNQQPSSSRLASGGMWHNGPGDQSMRAAS